MLQKFWNFPPHVLNLINHSYWFSKKYLQMYLMTFLLIFFLYWILVFVQQQQQNNKLEKSIRHVAMVAKSLEDLKKPWSRKYGRKKIKKKLTRMTFLCIIALRNKTVFHTFLPWFDNVNGRLCQERLLRSRNSATMVTRYHTTLFYSGWLFYLHPMRWNSQNKPIKRKSWSSSSNHLKPPGE